MAYTSCVSSIAANIAPDCANPQVGGYTGRGVLIPVGDAPVIVTDAENPRKIKSITPADGKKFVAVDNVISSPFSGSNTGSNADGGTVKYVKTVSMRVPLRGADASRDIVEPLAQSALGFILIAEKRDKVGDGSFEVIGYLDGLRVNADGVTRDESANDGATTVTMSCTEPWFEVVYLDTDYSTTLEAFEGLLKNSVY